MTDGNQMLIRTQHGTISDLRIALGSETGVTGEFMDDINFRILQVVFKFAVNTHRYCLIQVEIFSLHEPSPRHELRLQDRP